jgi:transcriptional regulator with XRE-family HTH domain
VSAPSDRGDATDGGTVLRGLREQRGWGQQELAQRAGLSIRTVQRWEQRRFSSFGPDAGVVLRVADVLGCDAREVLEPEWLAGTSWESSAADDPPA